MEFPNHVWSMKLSPFGKLVALAIMSNGTFNVEELSTVTGLDKSTTDRAIREYKKAVVETLPTASLDDKNAPTAKLERSDVSLADVLAYFQKQARSVSVITSKSGRDFSKLRSACRMFGTVNIVRSMESYFQSGAYRQDANVGINSLLWYVRKNVEPKVNRKRLPIIRVKPRAKSEP
jgi:hypothetical protein